MFRDIKIRLLIIVVSLVILVISGCNKTESEKYLFYKESGIDIKEISFTVSGTERSSVGSILDSKQLNEANGKYYKALKCDLITDEEATYDIDLTTSHYVKFKIQNVSLKTGDILVFNEDSYGWDTPAYSRTYTLDIMDSQEKTVIYSYEMNMLDDKK